MKGKDETEHRGEKRKKRNVPIVYRKKNAGEKKVSQNIIIDMRENIKIVSK